MLSHSTLNDTCLIGIMQVKTVRHDMFVGAFKKIDEGNDGSQ